MVVVMIETKLARRGMTRRTLPVRTGVCAGGGADIGSLGLIISGATDLVSATVEYVRKQLP